MSHSLKSLLTCFVDPEKNWKVQLLQQWPTIMGSMARHVDLEKIHDDTLTLSVENSCWMQELHALTPLLLATINQNIDGTHIKHLRFVKRALRKKKSGTVEHINNPAQIMTVELKPQEQEVLSTISDTTLRNALKQFLIRCYQENI